MQRRAPLYDKSREGHYNLISALHKTIRGSDRVAPYPRERMATRSRRARRTKSAVMATAEATLPAAMVVVNWPLRPPKTVSDPAACFTVSVTLGAVGNSIVVSGVESLTGGANSDVVTLGGSGSTLTLSGVEVLTGGANTDIVTLTGTGNTISNPARPLSY